MLLMSKYVVLFEKELTKLISTSKKLCAKRTELSSAFQEFGMSLNTFRVTEGNSQFQSPESIKLTEEVFTGMTETFRQQGEVEMIILAENLNNEMFTIQAFKATMKAKDAFKKQCTDKKSAVEKMRFATEMMREQVHQSGKNEKGLQKQEAQLEQAQEDLENLQQRHATYAQVFATELARFHRTKCENITELFRSYAQLNIDFYQSLNDSWMEFANRTETMDVPKSQQ